MAYFESPEFFLEEGRATLFEFGAYLGSCKDVEGQRTRALDFLIYFGIIPKRTGSVECPKCKKRMTPWTDVRANVLGWRWKCQEKATGCGSTVSPLKGTLLGKAKLPPEKCLKLLLCWFLQHEVTEAAGECGVSTETAVDWFCYFREIDRVVEGHDIGKIGGDDDIVEVDESKCFKRKYGRGRLLKKETSDIWITGGVSRKTKIAFAHTVPNRTRETLHPFLMKHINKGTFVFSDGWVPYVGLDTIEDPEEPSRGYFKGFASVNHSKNFVRPEPERITGLEESLYCLPRDYLSDITDENERKGHAKGENLVAVHTQNIERLWEELKKPLRTSRGSDDAIDDYIGAFLYRHNILRPLQTTGKKLERFLKDICRVYPGTGKVPIVDLRRELPSPAVKYMTPVNPKSVPNKKTKRKRHAPEPEKTFDVTYEELQESSTVENDCSDTVPYQAHVHTVGKRKQKLGHQMYNFRLDSVSDNLSFISDPNALDCEKNNSKNEG